MNSKYQIVQPHHGGSGLTADCTSNFLNTEAAQYAVEPTNITPSEIYLLVC